MSRVRELKGRELEGVRISSGGKVEVFEVTDNRHDVYLTGRVCI